VSESLMWHDRSAPGLLDKASADESRECGLKTHRGLRGMCQVPWGGAKAARRSLEFPWNGASAILRGTTPNVPITTIPAPKLPRCKARSGASKDSRSRWSGQPKFHPVPVPSGSGFGQKRLLNMSESLIWHDRSPLGLMDKASAYQSKDCGLKPHTGLQGMRQAPQGVQVGLCFIQATESYT
jgi:hypothetical protein